MNKTIFRNYFLGLTGVVLLATSASALAGSSVKQMKACKIAVLEKNKFRDLPMAAVSVFQGKNKKHPDFTVRWDGLKANGNCKVNEKGVVKKVNIKKFHDGRTGNRNGGKWSKSDNEDGFYYDRHVGKWRDPDGEVCHSCTPDNGFPRGGYHR